MPATPKMSVVGLAAMTRRSLNWSADMLQLTADLPVDEPAFIVQRDGMKRHDPLVIAADQMLLIAERYRIDHGGNRLSEDPPTAAGFAQAVIGLQQMLDGPGSFDHGTINEILARAITTAGL